MRLFFLSIFLVSVAFCILLYWLSGRGLGRNAYLEAHAPEFTSQFGDAVLVFNPSMDMESVQKVLDALHMQQRYNQFGPERYAILFEPGEYDLEIKVDYYVHAMGLGRLPSDVRVNGVVQSSTSKGTNENVTTMFWRAAENFLVVPDEPVYWAVSQAAPYRRMHIQGDLRLDLGGWASGGYLANSIIEGQAGLTSGQQWFTRNCELGSWEGGNWNRTFQGTVGAPPDTWPSEPTTVIEKTPVIREKPFLTVDAEGNYAVFVPELVRNAVGVSWKDGPEPGELVPLENFHIAFPGTDDAASLNRALAEGKHLLFTPGIYYLEESIRVERENAILFGLGLPTLVPQSGQAAITTKDVSGIKLVGLMVDAGLEESPALIQIGPEGANRDHSENPISLHDVFCRVGGSIPGKTEACLVVNSNHVILDHAWLWRADHGAGAEWDVNTCKNGLVVNGDDVTAYGLFNEHFQEYQTLWNGERGRTYFYQSEIPYDPPSQERWMNRDRKGFASYKVADHVEDHHAWGLGIYSFFGVRAGRDLGVRLGSAIECPEAPGVRFTHVTTFAGWFGGIDHPVNELGDPTNAQALLFFDGVP
ncbi:MAG: adenylyl cyclase [Puniceicoccaceae bacterium]